MGFTLSPDGRKALVRVGRSPGARTFDDLLLLDLTTHASQRITTHGQRLWIATFDPSGRAVVSADVDGVVRAGPITGKEPHLLRDPTSSAGWTLDVGPFPGWKDVPTW